MCSLSFGVRAATAALIFADSGACRLSLVSSCSARYCSTSCYVCISWQPREDALVQAEVMNGANNQPWPTSMRDGWRGMTSKDMPRSRKAGRLSHLRGQKSQANVLDDALCSEPEAANLHNQFVSHANWYATRGRAYSRAKAIVVIIQSRLKCSSLATPLCHYLRVLKWTPTLIELQRAIRWLVTVELFQHSSFVFFGYVSHGSCGWRWSCSCGWRTLPNQGTFCRRVEYTIPGTKKRAWEKDKLLCKMLNFIGTEQDHAQCRRGNLFGSPFHTSKCVGDGGKQRWLLHSLTKWGHVGVRLSISQFAKKHLRATPTLNCV